MAKGATKAAVEASTYVESPRRERIEALGQLLRERSATVKLGEAMQYYRMRYRFLEFALLLRKEARGELS